MIVTSRIRTLFLAQHIMVAFGLGCLIWYCVYQGIYADEERKRFIFSVMTLIPLTGLTIGFYQWFQATGRMKYITIDESRIFIQYFSGKSQVVLYADIREIATQRERLYHIRGVPASDGYRIYAILLKDRSEIVLSQNQFENYQELVSAVHFHLQNAGAEYTNDA